MMRFDQGDRTKHHSVEIGKFGLAPHDAERGIEFYKRLEDSYIHDLMVYGTANNRTGTSQGEGILVGGGGNMHDTTFERVYSEDNQGAAWKFTAARDMNRVTVRDGIAFKSANANNIHVELPNEGDYMIRAMPE